MTAVRRSRSERVYVAIFDGGRKARFFRDLRLMCNMLHLDYHILGPYLRERGWWCGVHCSIIAGTFETPAKNFGKY